MVGAEVLGAVKEKKIEIRKGMIGLARQRHRLNINGDGHEQ